MTERITVKREDLVRALQLIANLADKRQLQPVLSYTLVRVEGTRITFTASDSEIEVSSYLDSKNNWSDEPFTFAMPGKKLLEICRALTNRSMVELSLADNLLHIASNESSFVLPTLPADDFPLINTEQSSFQVGLTYNEFKRLLTKTAFTIPIQDIRHYLTGMLMDFDGDSLQVIATDGHRLAAARAQLTQPAAENKQIIVPRRTIMELLRMLIYNDDTELTISCNYQYFQISHPCFRLISKLIEGRFPNWKRIIPKKGEIKVELATEEFIRSVQRVNLLVNEVFRSVALNFVPGWLQLTSNNPGQEARDRLPLDYQGESFTVLLNVEYLREILRVVTTPEIVLFLKRELSGIIIEEKDAGEGNLYVIMPIKQ